MNFGVYGWAAIGVFRGIRQLFGKGAITALLGGVSEANRAVIEAKLHASSCYDGSMITEVLVQLEKERGDGTGAVSYKAGYETGKLAVEVMFPVYKSITHEERFFASLPRLWDRMMENAGNVEVVPNMGNNTMIVLHEYPSTETVWPHFWAGWIAGAVESACASQNVNIIVETCTDSDGYRYEFRVSWQGD